MIDLPTSNGQNGFENEFGKGRAIFVTWDVTKADDLEKTFRKIIDAFKELDILINNANIFNDNYWKKTIDLNIKALIHYSMLTLDYMGKQRWQRRCNYINIASITGLTPTCFVPIYYASKYAILGFSQSLANMYKTGVRMVIMCPDATTTWPQASVIRSVTPHYVRK